MSERKHVADRATDPVDLEFLYLGMPKDEQKEWTKAMLANVDYPRDRMYHDKDGDSKADKIAKDKVRDEYNAKRKQEITFKLKKHDGARKIGRVTFEKGKAVKLSAMVDDDDEKVMLTRVELLKLNSLTFNQVFARKPELQKVDLQELKDWRLGRLQLAGNKRRQRILDVEL